MKRLERDLDGVRERRGEAERIAFQAEARRPNVEQVAELWRHFHQFWEEVTERERTEIAQSLVEEVALAGKREGILRLRVNQILPRNPNQQGQKDMLPLIGSNFDGFSLPLLDSN